MMRNHLENPDAIPSGPRTSRTVRFSDCEWQLVEREAKMRGMSAAGLVRLAAIGLANGEFSEETRENSAGFPPEILAWTRVIFNGVYLLATLKQEEMVRDGREDELDRIGDEARAFNESVTNPDS